MMLTPCWPSAGPTGGAGVAAPALIWSLMTAVNRFLGGMTSFYRWWFSSYRGRQGASDLADLVERQLDGRLAAEDGNQHLQLLLLGVDLVDGGGEVREGAVHDGDRLADLEVHDGDRSRDGPGGGLAAGGTRGLRRGGGHQDLDNLVDGQRRGPRGGTDEARDARGVADGAPRLVVELHPDQQVAGQDLAVDLRALAVLDLGDLFGGHLDLIDVVLDVQGLDAGLEVGLHLVLVARVGVHDVPVAGRDPQRLAHRLGRVQLGLVLRGELGGLVGGRRRGGQRVAGEAVGVAALD